MFLLLLTESSGGSLAPGGSKFIFKSPKVTISVVKKPSSTSNNKGPAKQEEEHKSKVSSTALQSLFQNYESDEDD